MLAQCFHFSFEFGSKMFLLVVCGVLLSSCAVLTTAQLQADCCE